MKIALDYDKTYNADKPFWNSFIGNALNSGIDVRIVTTRSPTLDPLTEEMFAWKEIPVIYCDGVAKRFVCHHYHDWDPDIWIDDKPEGVDRNSGASKEILAEWRKSPEHTL